MWEAIQANRRRSRLLIGLMAAILVGFGALIGMTLGGEEAALIGVAMALVIWLVLLTIALSSGEKVILLGAGARPIQKEDAPQLFNVVEEMTIAAGLGSMPKVFVIDDERPNAFAVGRRVETACVAVTTGLVRRLGRDELQGVVAHEIGHIRNMDTRFMTTALVMVGSIALMSDMFLRMMWFGGGRRRGSKGGNAQTQMLVMVATLLAAILAPVAAQMLYLACSRRREFLADASAARFTRYPEGLASALEKIAGSSGGKGARKVLRAMAPLYIINPLKASASAGLFSTHPPTAQRVKILRTMAGTAGWVDYNNAFRQVAGRSCLDEKLVASEGSIAARAASVEAEPRREAVTRSQEVSDLLDRFVDVLLITCACGIRIKVPGEIDKDSIRCTRCGRTHAIPRAELQEAVSMAAAATVAARAAATSTTTSNRTSAAPGTLLFRRQGKGWQSFKCACGKVQQISPALQVKTVRCKRCRRHIEIEDA